MTKNKQKLQKQNKGYYKVKQQDSTKQNGNHKYKQRIRKENDEGLNGIRVTV